MNNSTVYFNDYYNRRSSSGKIELCMSPSSSSTIAKSHSLEEITDISQRRRHPSLGFLEFSKTANFRSRRDAVFQPLELQRVVVTVPTAPIVENTQKRKTDGSVDTEAAKKLKHG